MRAKEGSSSLQNAKGHTGRKVIDFKNRNFATITVMLSNLEVYLALLSGVLFSLSRTILEYYHWSFKLRIDSLNYEVLQNADTLQ